MALTQISTAGVKDDAVTAGKIPADAIGSSEIAANAVGSSELADNAVDTAAIAADAVTGAKIADDAINSEHYTDGSIDTAHIADLNITTAKIAADAITGAKIADDAINSEHYTDGSIDTAHIADSQITTAKIADNAVTTSKLPANSVTTTQIADSHITTAKINNSAVTTAKIAADAVTNAKIAASAISATELDSNAVTTAKIAGDAVTNAKLADNSVATEQIADDAVTNAKVADDAIGVAQLSASGTASSSTFLRGDNSWTAVNTDLVSDTSPQLGGTLDCNDQDVQFKSSGATKIQYATGNSSLEFVDDAQARFGSGDDLKIYHNGTHSYITNATNDLSIECTTNDAAITLKANALYLQDESNQYFLKGKENTGAVELYYGNSKKLETTSDGGTLTGTWTGAGKILQVASTTKTDTFSESVSAGGTSSAIISVNITPASSSNKIIVIADLSASFSDTGVYLKLFRDSTQIARGDAAGSRQRVSTHLLTDQNFLMSSCSAHYLDSPGTTSQITYSLRAGHPSPSNTTIYVNRSNSDGNAVQIPRGVSTLMLMEVSA